MISNLRNEKGFTLLEALVVVAILGLIAVIAIPNLLTWRDHHRVKSAARDIYSALQLARMKAISKGVEYRIMLDLDNETFWLQEGNLASGSDADLNILDINVNEIDLSEDYKSLSNTLSNIEYVIKAAKIVKNREMFNL